MSHISYRDNPDIDITAQQHAGLEALADQVEESCARAYHDDECGERCAGWDTHVGNYIGPFTTLAWALTKGYLRLPEVYTVGGLRPPGGAINVEAPDGTRWFRISGRAQFNQNGGPGTARNIDALLQRYPRLVEILTRH